MKLKRLYSRLRPIGPYETYFSYNYKPIYLKRKKPNAKRQTVHSILLDNLPNPFLKENEYLYLVNTLISFGKTLWNR